METMTLTTQRILIVEDEAIVALDIRSQLEGLGYTVVGQAATARQACEMADRLQPDLVLMDIHLQGEGDGIEAAHQIRLRRPVPVVFLTAYADSETLSRAKDVQPYGYIVKPFSEQDLHTTIQIALHKGQTDRVLQQSHEDMLAVLDAQRQGTILVDAKGCVMFLSRAARRLVGESDESASGRRWQEVLKMSSDEAKRLTAAIDRSSQQRQNIPAALARNGADAVHVEIEVQDDPRDASRKILLLYDVTNLHQLRQQLGETACFEGIVGTSDAIRQVVRMVVDFAEVNSTVLIEGESGTGKELVARAIHQRSRRSKEPFLPLNCAGLSEELAMSQLFGHRKGAFTGAVEDRPGLFEAAGGGTLFLDEIGELSPRVQTALLRVLEENAVMRLGETQLRSVYARILAASNRDLASEAAQGRFRSDLFYRIRVIRVNLPTLRERRKDIPLLVRTFLVEHGAAIGKTINAVSDHAMAALVKHPWPGNVRELKNALEFAVIRARGPVVQRDDLPPEILAPGPNHADDLSGNWADDERQRIVAALKRTGGNRTAAAQLLGIGRATLYRRIAQLGIADGESS
jgi:DNA-binding NtrC family response regulator